MLDLSFRAPGAMRAERVLARVHELVVDEQIENLAVPFTFHRAEEMISVARSAAAQALEGID